MDNVSVRTTSVSEQARALTVDDKDAVSFWSVDPFAHLPWPTFAGQVAGQASSVSRATAGVDDLRAPPGRDVLTVAGSNAIKAAP